MSPPNVSLIFLVGVLRVQNRHLAIPQKLNHFVPLCLGKISRFLPVDSILRSELQFKWLVRFVVRHVGDRPGAGKEPVAGADARVIRKLCLHLHLADLKLHVLELLDREMTRQVMQTHWKERRLHLASQDGAQASTRSFITKNTDQILTIISRGKEWQTLNVIPVGVGNQKSQFERLPIKLLFQRQAE